MSATSGRRSAPARLWTVAGDERWPVRHTGRRVASTAVVAVAAWLATSEVDRLIGGMPDDVNRSATVAELVSPGALGARSAWETWSAGLGGLRSLVVVHSVLDVALFSALGLLLLWALRDCTKARMAVLGYLAAEVLELGALLAALAALDRTGSPDVPDPLSLVVALVAVAKWLLLLLGVLLAATSPRLRSWWWGGLVRVWTALYFQRLSLVVLALVALLTLVSGPNVWDQLPDVHRGWVADCRPFGGSCRGAGHGLATLVTGALVTAGLVLLGRQRAERAAAASRRPYRPRPEAQLTGWWAVPAAVLLVALLLGPMGLDVVGVGAPLGFFAGLPLALLLLSLLFDARRAWRDGPDGPGPERAPTHAADVRRAGDALALALPVVLLLALVRAYTSLSALALVARPGAPALSGTWAAASLLLVLAVPGALLVVSRGPAAIARAAGWHERPAGLRRTVGDLLDPDEPDALRTPRARATPFVAWLLSVAGLALLLLAPQAVTAGIGVVGTILLGLGLWALFLGFLQVRLQKRRPLRIFRAFSLRATPVLTLLVAVPLLAGLVSSDRDLHAVRALPGAPVQAALPDVLDAWVAETEPCAVPSDVPGVEVQPMLLVAASGGGIRAAYWTAHVMDRLHRQGVCGNDATLLSSGVSGGAVGLALSRDGSGASAVQEMADPDALGAASAGLLVGDTVAGVAGLRVPALLDGRDDWLDRSGLMETRWEQVDEGLAERFDRIGDGPSGALVLNSAAAGAGCRVLVSQLALTEPAGGVARALASAGDEEQAAAQCTRPSGGLAASIDLYDLYAHRDCRPANLRLVSAAMLAARFPTVTPGGRMPVTAGGCAPRPDVQLVDGGYGESSGVGTLADLAPRLASLIRERNATPRRVIVPIVVFLEEEPRIDLAPRPARLAPEALVPLAGRRAAAAQTTSGTWLQRASAALEDVCPPGTAGASCREVVTGVRRRLPAGAVIVAPRTQPDVDAPLGWTLSGASRARLEAAMDEQAAPDCRAVRGYGCLGRLLPLLRR